MISKLSDLHPEAILGENVSIGSFSSISANVHIGEGTWIGPNVTIFEGARIGKNCRIFPGAVISAIPQDLKFRGEETFTEIGDNTTIRECVTVNRGTAAAGKTVIGNNCLLMAYVHIAHDCILGNNIIIANSVNLAGHVLIDDFAILEGYVGVSQFMRIGMHSFIAGQTGVRKDVPPYVKAAREPLSFAGINAVGLRRRGFSSDSINRIQDIYRILYQQGYAMQKAIETVDKEIEDCPEKSFIINFINQSEKGVIKGFTSMFSED